MYTKQVGLDNYGGELTEYFACTRPQGEPVEIGQSDTGDGEYPANFATSDLTISGTYVADIQTSGMADAAGCAKYDPTADCQASITSFVEVVDAKTHRRLQTTATSGIGPLAVSPLGALAWVQSPGATSSSSPPTLQAVVLRRGAPRQLTGTIQTLDTGAIGSLSFSGLSLRWTNAGQAKSQTL